MRYRHATPDDAPLLAALNRQLIEDEGHRNRMTVAELTERVSVWLAGEYRAVIFEDSGALVAYALYREAADEIYCRQLFVARDRRRQGIGRRAVELLRVEIWPRGRRHTVDVLVTNVPAIAFWRSVGFSDYSLALERLPEEPGPVQ